MKGRSQPWLLPLVGVGIFLAIWHAAVVFSGTSVFPAPGDVARGVTELAHKGRLIEYVRDSSLRVALGYGLAVVFGIPLGLLLGWYPGVARWIDPLLQMLRPISPLAWMPLAVVWFGIGNVTAVFLIFISSLFPVFVATMNGIRGGSGVFVQAGSNFGLSGPALLRRVVLPAALPRILVGLRIALGVAWLVVVAAEMIAVDSGLGYLVIDSRNAGKRYDLVVAAMLLIGLIGLGLDTAIRGLQRVRALRWGVRHD